MDYIQDEYGSEYDVLLPGWQIIGQTMAIYLMLRCGNMYIMVHVRDMSIPDSLMELGSIGANIKTWMEMKATIEQGLSPVLAAVASGGTHGTGTPGGSRIAHCRLPSICTPEFKSFLQKK
ncbi:hypothetical protein BGZ76_006245 [Entomortierella beljakovae]|nr:hypothetical protein BGZ76_006245 [Entomortierella beljakovae]